MELPSNALLWAFPVIVVVAGATTYQFYRGRKKNLEILRDTIRVMERVYSPLDKNYVVVGIYVGYNAQYKVLKRGIGRVEVTVLLLPRQSLLYLPIAKVTSRFDKVYIQYMYSGKVVREAHVVRKGYYRLGIRREIRGIEKMMVTEEIINGVRYHLIYTDRSALQPLIDFVKSLPSSVVNHVALVPANNSLYVAARLDMRSFEELVKNSYELAAKLAP